MHSEEPTRPATLNYAVERRPARWRTPAAVALALGGGLAADYGLSFSGFGFFPAWLFLTFACPVLLCLLAASRHVLVASLFAVTMMGSLMFRALGLHESRGVLMLVAVLAAISLAVAASIGAAWGARANSHNDRE